MSYTQKIQSIHALNHNVYCIRLDKPPGYRFVPGQATEAAVNKDGWKEEKRPFTFTGLNDAPYLEFTIKSYRGHDGVTRQVGLLKAGDELIIDDSWGAIEYKGEGYFIAGGAGITPFIAILRELHKEGKAHGNKLFFSNKTANDIFYEDELRAILGNDAVFIVTEGNADGYLHDYIDKTFLEEHVDDFGKHFYVCGPDPMIKSISAILAEKGVKPDAVVFEK